MNIVKKSMIQLTTRKQETRCSYIYRGNCLEKGDGLARVMNHDSYIYITRTRSGVYFLYLIDN